MMHLYGPTLVILTSIFAYFVTALPVVGPVSDLSPNHLTQCGDTFYNATTSSCVNSSNVCPFVGGQVVNTTLPQPCDPACSATVPAHYRCEGGLLDKSYTDGTEGSPTRHLPVHPGDYVRNSGASPPAPAQNQNELGTVKRDPGFNGTITNSTEAGQTHHLSNHPGDYRRPSEPSPSASAKPMALVNPKDPFKARRDTASNGDSDIGKSGATTIINVDENGVVSQSSPKVRSEEAKRDSTTDEYVNAAVNDAKTPAASESSDDAQLEQQGSPTDMFPAPKQHSNKARRDTPASSSTPSGTTPAGPPSTPIPQSVSPVAANPSPKVIAPASPSPQSVIPAAIQAIPSPKLLAPASASPKSMEQNFVDTLLRGGVETERLMNKTSALPESSDPSQPTPAPAVPLSGATKRDQMPQNYVNTLVEGARTSIGASSYDGESMQASENSVPALPTLPSLSARQDDSTTTDATPNDESIAQEDSPLPTGPAASASTPPVKKGKRDSLSDYHDLAGPTMWYDRYHIPGPEPSPQDLREFDDWYNDRKS